MDTEKTIEKTEDTDIATTQQAETQEHTDHHHGEGDAHAHHHGHKDGEGHHGHHGHHHGDETEGHGHHHHHHDGEEHDGHPHHHHHGHAGEGHHEDEAGHGHRHGAGKQGHGKHGQDASSSSELICPCMGTTTDDIVQAVAAGATTLEDIERQTGAGTRCGHCRQTVAACLDAALAAKA